MSERSCKKRVVVCGLLRNKQGLILLTQRRKGVHLELLWEFPGGKVEASEDLKTALARELLEELGIDACIGQEIARTEYAYQEIEVELVLFDVLSFSGEIQTLEVNDFRFVSRSFLFEYKHLMPPADWPLIEKIDKLLTNHPR